MVVREMIDARGKWSGLVKLKYRDCHVFMCINLIFCQMVWFGELTKYRVSHVYQSNSYKHCAVPVCVCFVSHSFSRSVFMFSLSISMYVLLFLRIG